MTTSDARKLATTIARESDGIVIKLGVTNGRPLVHLVNNKARKSVTLYNTSEWTFHEWNKTAQKKEREPVAG